MQVENNKICTTRPYKISILRELRKKTRELRKWRTGLNQVLLGFASFCLRFIQGFSKAKPLTLMLKTTITRSAKNSPLDMAEDAEIGEGDGGDNEMIKKSPLSKKPNIPTRYFTSLRFEKRWISLDSFWPLLKLLVKGTIGKAIKQSFYWATQVSHLNQSLWKSTFHRYNKLSSCQVRRTYKLSWYYSTSIIKL